MTPASRRRPQPRWASQVGVRLKGLESYRETSVVGVIDRVLPGRGRRAGRTTVRRIFSRVTCRVRPPSWRMKDLCLSPAKNCPRRLAARWNRTERLPGWPRPFTVCSPLFASLTLSPSAPPPAPRLRPSRPSSLSLRGARHLRACCSLFPAAPASPSVPHPAAHLLTFPQRATAHPGGCHAAPSD